MKVRLYLDEDSMRLALVETLRARSVEVIAALEQGMVERTDEDHLEHATAQGHVLYSYNVGDYFRLHTAFLREGRAHAGIILARQQHYSVGEQMRRLLKLIAALSAEEMQNRVEFLSAWG
jgi:hypothetical protein